MSRPQRTQPEFPNEVLSATSAYDRAALLQSFRRLARITACVPA
ncbi:hypothetical protein QCN29_04090 [Streptomyces sp. HNM0663]|uniref:Uncharacterized protein n=1 Tax=Streptomyces chengmaiensis TaxID=3040919 RepID=A0ABT6HJB7_9ACTN|nr:hypothetical protein [Streptomyces chengmaiensis]MDH2387979.1 hypothetical protein [Streptomyces chengmaiensis]